MTRKARITARIGALMAALTLAGEARADDDGGLSGRDLVVAANTGLQWGIAPGIFVPTNGGNVGFSIGGHVGYGIELEPLILVPAVSLRAYFPNPGSAIVMPMAQSKLMYPIGAFAPYVIGGAGTAIFTGPAGGAYFALEGGGGAIYYFSPRFALGVEATYTSVFDTPFNVLSIGPVLMIGF